MWCCAAATLATLADNSVTNHHTESNRIMSRYVSLWLEQQVLFWCVRHMVTTTNTDPFRIIPSMFSVALSSTILLSTSNKDQRPKTTFISISSDQTMLEPAEMFKTKISCYWVDPSKLISQHLPLILIDCFRHHRKSSISDCVNSWSWSLIGWTHGTRRSSWNYAD